MSTVAVTDFLPWVLPSALGCPEPTAVQHIVAAARELCNDSGIVQATFDPINLAEGVVEYELDSPESQQEIAWVLRAWNEGSPMQPAANEHVLNVLAYKPDAAGVTVQQGVPREFFTLGPRAVGVYPIPQADVAGALIVRASLRPTRAATRLAQVLYDDWVEVVAAGALSRLHSVLGQSYSSEALAAVRSHDFRRGVAKARNEAQRGRHRGELRVQQRPFA